MTEPEQQVDAQQVDAPSDPMAVMSTWDVMSRTIVDLARETTDPYVSKPRLKAIAQMALVQCMALVSAAQTAEAQEAAAQQAQPPEPESNSKLILPQDAEKGIILL